MTIQPNNKNEKTVQGNKPPLNQVYFYLTEIKLLRSTIRACQVMVSQNDHWNLVFLSHIKRLYHGIETLPYGSRCKNCSGKFPMPGMYSTKPLACVVRDTKQGQVLLAKLGKDDFFGKIPFLDLGNEPYSASIYGSADLKADPVDMAFMQAEFDKLPLTIKNIMESTAICIAATTQAACNAKKG